MRDKSLVKTGDVKKLKDRGTTCDGCDSVSSTDVDGAASADELYEVMECQQKESSHGILTSLQEFGADYAHMPFQHMEEPTTELKSKTTLRSKASTTALYGGHRSRMREKLFKCSGDSLFDYELLEILLFSTIARRDVRSLAKNLIKHCGGGITNVFWAEPEKLRKVDGVSDATVATITCVRSILERSLRDSVQAKPVPTNWQELIKYLRITTKHSVKEYLRVIYLNKKNMIIRDSFNTGGTVDRVSIYVREIIKQALDIGAISIIISHNHISGDPKPSDADISATERLIESCEAIGLKFLDHIIVSDDSYFSFKESDLI